MAIGSGLGSSLGFSAETTWGTRVAPTKFLRAKSYAINREPTLVQGEGIVGGGYGPLLDHFVETVYSASAAVAFDVPQKNAGLGVFLNTLLGGTVTATQIGTTGAYTQAHTLADPLGKSMTVQIGAPHRDGTVACREMTGAKVLSMEFSCDAKGILAATAKLDGKAFDTSQSLAAPSWGASAVFDGKMAALKLGTFASEAAVSGIREVSCSIEREVDADDFTYGAGGTKNQPVLSGDTKITGSVTYDWTAANKTAFEDRIAGASSCALVWEFVSTVAIGGTAYPTFRISLPSVTWEGDMQGVDGKEALSSKADFTWRYDGTNLPVITYISADTAL